MLRHSHMLELEVPQNPGRSLKFISNSKIPDISKVKELDLSSEQSISEQYNKKMNHARCKQQVSKPNESFLNHKIKIELPRKYKVEHDLSSKSFTSILVRDQGNSKSLSSSIVKRDEAALIENYRTIITFKSKTKVNRAYQILKSYNGNYHAVYEVDKSFTLDELKIIYELRHLREEGKAFTPEEDELLCVKVNLMGSDFKKICKYFKNKTPCDLKKRYTKIKNLNNLLPFSNLSNEERVDLELLDDNNLSVGGSGYSVSRINENTNNTDPKAPQAVKNFKINIGNFQEFINPNKSANIMNKSKESKSIYSFGCADKDSTLKLINQVLYSQEFPINHNSVESRIQSVCEENESVMNNIEQQQLTEKKIIMPSYKRRKSDLSFIEEDEFENQCLLLKPVDKCNTHDTLSNESPTYLSNTNSADQQKNIISNRAVHNDNEDFLESDSILRNYKLSFKFMDDDEKIFSDNLFKFSSFEQDPFFSDEDRIKLMKEIGGDTTKEISDISYQINKFRAASSSIFASISLNDISLSSLLSVKQKFEGLNNLLNNSFFKISSSSTSYSMKYESKLLAISNFEISEKSKKTHDQINKSIDGLGSTYINYEDKTQTKFYELLELIKRVSISSSNLSQSQLTIAQQSLSELVETKNEIIEMIKKKFELTMKMVSFLKIKVVWLQKISEIF